MTIFILVIVIFLLGSLCGGIIVDLADVRWVVFIRNGEVHIGLSETYEYKTKDIITVRNVSYTGALISYYTVKNRHKWEK